MPHFAATALVTCAAMSVATCSHHGTNDDRQTIVHLEPAWLTALQQHDRSGLQLILADDFLDISTQVSFATVTSLFTASRLRGRWNDGRSGVFRGSLQDG